MLGKRTEGCWRGAGVPGCWALRRARDVMSTGGCVTNEPLNTTSKTNDLLSVG